MSEKPQKRLVSKGRYVYLLGKRMSLTILSKSAFTASVILLLGAVLGMYGLLDSFVGTVVFVLLASGLSGILNLMGMRFAEKASEMEDVQPITRDNICLLPSESILVRASDAPSSHQHAELLRAAPQGKETPAEDLLRASTDRQAT